MDIEPTRNNFKILSIIFTKYKKMCKSLFEKDCLYHEFVIY